MKKIFVLLLALALCAGLCGCGGKAEIEVPTKPIPSAAPSQSAEVSQSSTDAAAENTEALEPTGETYPWEAEFREEDYVKFEYTAPNGDKGITWREGSIFGTERRNLYEWAESGNIEDCYYYPSGNASHSYTWGSDGSYHEAHYLDDGYIDLENRITHNGTILYEKNIYPDGAESEYLFDENGCPIYMINTSADGIYSETYFFENGNMRKSIVDDPVMGEYLDQEYYENGNLKYSKYQTPEQTIEERCDEEGFHTYYYTKGPDWEQACIADETGKLVKVVENGVVKDDAATLAQYARDYNFKE